MFEKSKISEDGHYFYLYPNINDDMGHEGALPIHVFGIGVTECERHVNRENGYSYPQIIYTASGSGTLTVYGETFTVKENMGFFIPAGVPHEYYPNEEGWSTNWIAMRGNAVQEVFDGIGFFGPRVVRLGNTTRLDRIFHEIYFALSKDAYFGGLSAAADLYKFIIEFYRFSQDRGRGSNYENESPLTKILNYIDMHYSEDLTLDILCEDAGISPQHLCRLFRKKLDQRPMEYIANKRIQEAKALLVNTPKSIAEISQLVGYHNCNYFCITFKKHEGKSPSEYRRNMD